MIIIIISAIHIILHGIHVATTLVLLLFHLFCHHSRWLKVLHLRHLWLHSLHISIGITTATKSTSHLVVMETWESSIHTQFMLTVGKLAFASKFTEPKLLVMSAWSLFVIILIIILLSWIVCHWVFNWIVLNFLHLFVNDV